MYQLLTADDEQDKLEALRNNFPWQDYNVQLCGEACTGTDAYEQIVAKRPDLCIMDIKMPGISGLEAIRRARAQGITTKFVVLSGYDEFDYAKEAISLSTVEYLLKPCRPDDIIQAVLKCISLIEEESRQSKIFSDYRILLEGSEKSQRQQFLTSLLSGNSPEPSEEKVQLYRLKALEGPIAVFIFASASADDDAMDSGWDAHLQELSTDIERDFQNICKNEVLLFNKQIVVIANMEHITENFESVYAAVDSAIHSIKSEYGLACIAGVSDLKMNFRELHDAYSEARKAVNTSLFFFDRSIAFFAELDNAIAAKYPENTEKSIFSSINGDSKQLSNAVDLFFSQCSSRSADAKKRVQEAVITLIYNIVKSTLERGVTIDGLSEKKSSITNRILESWSLEDMKRILLDFLTDLSKTLTESRAISALTKKALLYLNENYARRITLENVAEEIHVTPSYLSMLFKQETGLNLIEYLNRLRIEKSKELIKSGNRKVYEVAYQVGYQDEKYFHMMFKRYTGLTTTQFKDGFSEGTSLLAPILSAR